MMRLDYIMYFVIGAWAALLVDSLWDGQRQLNKLEKFYATPKAPR